MPLDDVWLDGIAAVIAETERTFQKKLDDLAETTNDASAMKIDELKAAIALEKEAAGKRMADLAAAIEGTEQKLLDRLREERLELDEHLFAARKRYDQLSTNLEERLASLKDGEPGPPGADGEPGPAGEPGRDGADGITGEPRGKYDPEASYGKFDRVSFNGSEWIARQDTPGPLPGEGWMLGAQGKRGRPGIGIQGVAAQGYAVVLELDNGKTITLDLRGMFELYDQERGG